MVRCRKHSQSNPTWQGTRKDLGCTIIVVADYVDVAAVSHHLTPRKHLYHC